MASQPCYRRVLVWLITLLLTLPIVAWLLVAAAALLEAMGDHEGRVLFVRLAAACAALWVVDLVGCVVVLAVDMLGQQRCQPQPPDLRDTQAEE